MAPAGKRQATSQLTQDNWDAEEEPEERGVFQQAPEDILKKRVIKTAKRRIGGAGTDGSSGSTGLFKGLSAVGGLKPGIGGGAGLFGSSAPFPSDGVKFGEIKPAAPTSLSTATQPDSEKVDGEPPSKRAFAEPEKTNGNGKVSGSQLKDETVGSQKSTDRFLRKLKSLNESFLTYTTSHLKEKPYCILSPGLDDYKTHLKSVMEECGVALSEDKTEIVVLTSTGEPAQPLSSATSTVVPTENTAVSASGFFSSLTKGSASSTSKSSTSASGTTLSGSTTEPSSSLSSLPSSAVHSGEDNSDKAAPLGSVWSAPKSAASLFGNMPPPTTTTAGGSGLFSFGKPAGSTTTTTGSTTTNPAAAFSFGKASAATVSTSSHAAPSLSFGKAAATSTCATPALTFGKAGGAAGTNGSGFSLSAKPGGFVPPAPSTADQGSTGEEPYEPPKAEVTNKVTEEGAVYTQRVKLFYMKGESYVDRGVGNLFVKPAPGSEKFQLIVRADTNLGNILLNILLSKSMTSKRQGKNNVTLLCVPNPPMEPKASSTAPVLLLIRVKTGQDADTLLETLEEHKR